MDQPHVLLDKTYAPKSNYYTHDAPAFIKLGLLFTYYKDKMYIYWMHNPWWLSRWTRWSSLDNWYEMVFYLKWNIIVH